MPQRTVDAITLSEMSPANAFHRGAALGPPIDDQLVIRVVDKLLPPLLR